MKKMALTFFFVPFFLVGCSSANEQTIRIYNESEVGGVRADVEGIIAETEEVYNGIAVFVEDELLVSLQVKPWLAFKKQKIEERIQKQFDDQYPDLNVLVSTDFKLYWESEKLLEEKDQRKVVDEVQKLKELAKEET
ncbi:hypothetical protein ACIQ34_02380 [Ureibacillus sp. NPDC094379]